MENMEKTTNKDGKPKDVVVRMIEYYRAWYQARVGVPVQYSSKQSYVIEYNTMKGIVNMLTGSYRAKNPKVVPGDDIIFGMWQRMLDYIKAKNNYWYMTLLSIHRGYNTIVAQMMRHAEKVRFGERKKEADMMQMKLDIVKGMLGGAN